MHIVLRSVRSRKKINREKAQPPYLLMVHSPSVFQSICIRESIWTSCFHVPADFLKMRKNTHIQSNNLAACVWERQRLWLDWICDREMRPARKQQRRLIGRQMELSLFPCPFWSCFFTSQLNTTKNQFTSPTFVPFFD